MIFWLYFLLPRFLGRDVPGALTVILALGAAFVLSLTLVPALIAIGLTGRVQERAASGVARRGQAPGSAYQTSRRPIW